MPWHAITLELDAPQAEVLSEALMEAGAESVALDPVELLPPQAAGSGPAAVAPSAVYTPARSTSRRAGT